MDNIFHGILCIVAVFSLCYGASQAHPHGKAALIIIDVQNCFLPGGTLAVNNGDEVIPIINAIRTDLASRFEVVILSKDWHCVDHVSFASQHPGYDPLDTVTLYYDDSGSLCDKANITSTHAVNCTSQNNRFLRQTLWPDHCVINTTDAELRSELIQRENDVIIYKGDDCDLDSYSVFYDNGRYGETRLRGELESRGITSVYLTGLATDYCVYWSAKDAKELGYDTYVVVDATRGVAPETTQAAIENMDNLGITLLNSTNLLKDDVSPSTGAVTTMFSGMCLIGSILLTHLSLKQIVG